MQLDAAPLTTYGNYLTALGYRGDVSQHPGCQSKDDETGRTRCNQAVPDPSDVTATVVADMLSLKGDVTGHYLLVLRRYPFDTDGTGKLPKQGASLKAEPPHTSSGQLRTGDGLPGRLGAPGGPYDLLEGSDMIAMYGTGSARGGTELLLHIAAGVDVSSVAAAYAQQAAQFPGDTSTVGPSGEGGTVFTSLSPPGGDGGWQASVGVVDNPGTDQDYLYYTMTND